MKYNVFARPMFRRGGMSQGTGITSGLDTPRRNFGNGSNLSYWGQLNKGLIPSVTEKTQFPKSYRAGQMFGKGINYGKTGARALLASPMGVAAGLTAIAPPVIDALTERSPGAEKSSLFGIDLTGTKQYKDYQNEADRLNQLAEGKKLMTQADNIYNEKELSKSNTDNNQAVIDKINAKSEEDLLLEKLGDTSLSKGEKALMLSEIIGTAGGLEGKTKKALELAKSKAKQDRLTKRDITKLKYLQKGKERIAGISAGALGSTEKTIEAAIRAKKDGAKDVATGKDGVKTYDGKTEAQMRSDIYSAYTDKDKNVTAGLTAINRYGIENVMDLQKKIREGRAELKKGKLSEAEKKKLQDKVNELTTLSNMPGYEILFSKNYKQGGRVNYAQGTPMQEPAMQESAIAATQTPNANANENTRPVNKLSFDELRNRLPKEITDDVIQVIANSEEALQDFAYIKTQEDINKFNVKYGVNVMLPPQA